MLNLQPLRIPSGWTVEWNTFMKSDPDPNDMSDFSGSSLLHIYNRNSLTAINLEWTPEEDFDGEFLLRVINLKENFNPQTHNFDLEGDWENPDLEFTSKNRDEIVQKIEALMLQLPPFEDPRILKSRGIVDEEAEAMRLKIQNDELTDFLVSQIIETNSKQLHSILIDHPEVKKQHLEELIEHGAFKKIKNKASQKLNSKAFRDA